MLSVEGMGGAGKSALVAQALREWEPGANALVFVWSFYLRPDPDAFLADLYRERTGCDLDAAGLGRAEQVLEALRVADRRTVLILDGLERIQAVEPPQCLEDAGMEHLLRGIADTSCRCVATTRFPLAVGDVDVDARIERLPLGGLDGMEARDLLRRRGVVGADEDLDRVAAACAGHALALSLAAGAMQAFLEGRADRFDELGQSWQSRPHPPSTAGFPARPGTFPLGLWLDLPDAGVLHLPPVEAAVARVLAFYRERLDPPARALLERVCLFRAPVETEVLRDVFLRPGKEAVAGAMQGMSDEGLEAVAGAMQGMSDEALEAALERLQALGLLERTAARAWTAHPVVQQFFPTDLSKSSRLHAVVAEFLTTRPGAGLEKRDRAAFERGEEIIYHLVEAGRFGPAFRLYWTELGASTVLSEAGESARGERIVRRLLSLVAMNEDLRPRLQNELAIYLSDLSRLEESARYYWRAYRARRRQGSAGDACRIAQNLIENSLHRGLLRQAGKLAARASRMVMEHGLSQEFRSVEIYARYVEHLRGKPLPPGWRWADHVVLGTEALLSADALLRMRFYDLAYAVASKNHEKIRRASAAGEHHSLLQSIEASTHLLLARGQRSVEEVVRSALSGSSLARVLTWSQSGGDFALFAEALMFRAFLHFKRGDEAKSRADLERVLAIARRHGLRLIEIDALVRLSLLDGPSVAHEAMLLAFQPRTKYVWAILTAVSLALVMMAEKSPSEREAAWISAIDGSDGAVQERQARGQQEAARDAAISRVLWEAQVKSGMPPPPTAHVARTAAFESILDRAGLGPHPPTPSANWESVITAPLTNRLPLPGPGRALLLAPVAADAARLLARLAKMPHPDGLEADYAPIWNAFYQAHLSRPDDFHEYYHVGALLLLEGYDREAALVGWDAAHYGVADLAAACLHAVAVSRNDVPRAAEILEDSVKQAREPSRIELSTAEYDRGVLYEILGRLPDARLAYERACRLDWTFREARIRRDHLEPDRERCRHILGQVAHALDVFRRRHPRGDYPPVIHDLVPRLLGVEPCCPVSASPYEYRRSGSRGRFLLACRRPHGLRIDSSLGELSRTHEPDLALSPLETLLLDFPKQAVHFQGHTRVRVRANKVGRIIE